ncbi:hypothetical protein [Microbacterium sp. bgisy189]|uniref:hypothetical protein n=1 Tax=Microbacterium sp. bgisy189 TaxID=3413798 RepID=UPI003EBB4D15
MKVDVKTTDGKKMTRTAATEPVGTALRIAPGFSATTTDEAAGIETTLDAIYNPEQGRYIVTTIVNRGIRPGFDEVALRHTAPQAILQAAIPHCIAVHLEHGWTTIAELSATDGRIIPEWLATAVSKRGTKTERMEVIQILYGASALAGLPPTKTVQLELGIPHRTASDWISKARTAGYLKGMSYTPGRQPDD